MAVQARPKKNVQAAPTFSGRVKGPSPVRVVCAEIWVKTVWITALDLRFLVLSGATSAIIPFGVDG
jgi:hypothetical protein